MLSTFPVQQGIVAVSFARGHGHGSGVGRCCGQQMTMQCGQDGLGSMERLMLNWSFKLKAADSDLRNRNLHSGESLSNMGKEGDC